MTRKELAKKSKQLEKELKILEKKLKSFPAGTFFLSRNGKYQKWFYYNGKKQIYIPKKDKPLAEKLAYKRYLSDLYEDLTREKKAIDAYLKYHTHDTRHSDELLQNSSFRNLIQPFFKPRSQELIDWMNEPYEKSTSHPNHLTHKTSSGNIVRSKSEMLIDMALFKYSIPYRYECPLVLGLKTYHPDFTIRHPRTGELYYWEHLGRIDDPEYYRNTCKKIQDYIQHGIIPSYNLILTYETEDQPLSSELVEKIIQYYFLD